MGLTLQRLYDLSPAPLQTLLLNGYALRVHRERYGRRFRRISGELDASQHFSAGQIDDYQNRQLRRLVDHAYRTVPYYRELFDRHGLRPERIRSKEDLRLIPLLTREEVRLNRERLISSAFRKGGLVHGHTSGTTGSPLEFYWDRDTCLYTNAVDWRQKGWGGVRYGDRIALLLGRTVVPPRRTRPPFWRMNYLHNQLWLSSFHMSPENLDHYLRKLRRFAPAAIEGYPSTLYILAGHLLSTGRALPVKAAFTSSETLYDHQREAIERAFQCPLFDFYGMAERVLFATECEAHAGRHLNFEYGVTEIVDDLGEPLPDGRRGHVVGTSLRNFAMPFIRYKTSDVSAIRRDPCPCGRAMARLDPVTTKAEDIVVTPEGKMISPSVLTHPFKPLHGVAESQIVQEDLSHLRVRIVRRPGYADEETARLVAGLRERLGGGMEITVEFVTEIPRSANGKFRWVISRVPLSFPGAAASKPDASAAG